LSASLMALFALIAVAGCGDDAPSPAAGDSSNKATGGDNGTGGGATAQAKLAPASVGQAPNVHQCGHVYFAAQPSADDLRDFKEAGVKTVINLRMPGENKAFDEQQVVEQELGLQYSNPGFDSAQTLDDGVFFRVRDLLKRKEPVLVHCASANRVGAVWLAYRVLDDGVGYEQALAEAKQIGLKSEPLEERARRYIEAKQADE